MVVPVVLAVVLSTVVFVPGEAVAENWEPPVVLSRSEGIQPQEHMAMAQSDGVLHIAYTRTTQETIRTGQETRLFYRGIKGDMFHALDWSVVGHRDALVPGGAEAMGAANVFYSATLAWNTKKFSAQTAPKGWQDFIRLPGKKSLRGEAWATMEAGLMGDGIAANRLYPLDAERSLRTLSKVKADTIFWKKTKMALDLLT